MRKNLGSAVVLATMVLATAACGDGDTEQAEEEARETATSAATRLEAATRLTATLTGASEAPTPGDPDGAGTATVNIDATKGQACYEVSVQKVDRPVGMHIHDGEPGQSGPVVIPLTTPTASETTTTGCADADRTLLSRIAAQPGDFYVNVHTATYPQGAVRGPLS
jgi:hypothetical protein